MRNLKRVLSLALALVMVLGMMVITTSAAKFTDAEEITNTEAVDVMSAIGVITGDNGNFYPNRVLTREEGAAFICYMLMGKDAADKLVGSGNFADVKADRWSAGEIDYCANLGIVKGYTDAEGKTVFNPKGELTAVAFGRMLLGALGYDGDVEGYVGTNWASAIASDMIDAGLDVRGVTMDAQLTREQAAQMAFQALKATMVEYTTPGTTITVNGMNIVTGASAAEAVDNTNYEYRTDVTIGTGAGQDNTMQLCEKYFPTLKVAPAVDSFARDAKQWFLGASKTDNSYTGGIDTPAAKPVETADYTILITRGGQDLDDLVDTISYSMDTDFVTATTNTLEGTEEYLNGDLKTTVSGTTVTSYFATASNFEVGDTVELFMARDGKTVDKVIVSRYTADVVDSDPDAEVSLTDSLQRVKYYTSFKNAAATKDTQVPGFDAETYVKNAVVALAVKDNGTIIDSYVMEAVTGPITAYKAADNTYTIGGKAYKLSGSATDVAINGTVDFYSGNYALYLDNNGYILYTGVISAANAALEDVVYVVATYYKNNQTYSSSNEYKFYAQTVSLVDGTVADVEISPAQFAGLTLAGTATAGQDISSYVVPSNATNTGYTSGSAAATAGTKYYTATSTLAAGLYSFEDVAKVSYKEAVSYAPAFGANQVGTFNQTTELKGRETDIGGFKVNADTKYVLVKGSLGTLKTAVHTGGIAMAAGNFLNNANEDIAVYTKDANGNKVASHVILMTSSNDLSAASYTDLLYCYTTDSTAVKGGYNTEMYNLKGEKVTVYTKGSFGCTTGEFYKYSIDADGYYAFETAETEATWNQSFDKGVFMDEIHTGLYGTLISSTDKLADRDAANAKIIDLRSPAAKANSVYTSDITTLNALQAASLKGNVTFDAYASKANSIEIIFVQDVEVPEILSASWYDQSNGNYSISANFDVYTYYMKAGQMTVVLKDENDGVVAKTTSLRDLNSSASYISVPFWSTARNSSSWDSGHQNLGAGFETRVVKAEFYLYGKLVETYNFPQP